MALLPGILLGRHQAAAKVPVAAEDAARLLEEEVSAGCRSTIFPPLTATRCCVFSLKIGSGGRIYDVHIAEVAHSVGAKVIVTDNRRHFLSALRHDLRVQTPAEFLGGLSKGAR